MHFQIKMSNLVYICIVLTFAHQGLARNIVSPNNTVISESRETASLLPTLPATLDTPRCGQNMFAYPSIANENSWECRCRPGFLYFPLNDTCHEVYRQGPCQPGHYVIPLADGVAPQCIENPCLIDGLVPFNGTCYPLGSLEACSSGRLLVNALTLKIRCQAWAVAFRASIADAPPIQQPCPPGTVRVGPIGGCRIPI